MDDDLLAAMDRFQKAVETRDAPAADSVLDTGFALVLVHPAAVTVNREQWFATLADYVIDSYTVEESTVDGDDDVAVALHRVNMKATVLGQDRSGIFVISDIWRRRTDGWRLWRRHSTPLTAGEMPG